MWIAHRAFFGSATSKEEIIYITYEDIERVGYNAIVDSLIMPHISHRFAFNIYAKYLELPSKLKEGRYKIRAAQSVIDIVRMLKLGQQSPTHLIFNNIRTIEQLSGRLSHQIKADSMSILNTLCSPQILAFAGVESKEALLAVFIPNTYEVYWNISPIKLVERMVHEYNSFWNPERNTKREALKLSRLEVSTLASILYEETSQADEMPRVAGVYINRLNRSMKLQADPTVKYAIGDFEIKRVLFKHLKYDSPYNTYLYKGLPPTPIAMPSITAIDAVLNYEKHDYLYFCARPEFDGYHNFACTLSQHNANSRAYSKELNRRGIK